MPTVKALFYFVLFFTQGCENTETVQNTEENKPFIEIYEKFDIYNGSIKNGWGGYIMVAMDGSVLTDRISEDGGKTKLGSHETGQWVEFHVMREDSNDGKLKLKANANTGPNLMITEVILLSE